MDEISEKLFCELMDLPPEGRDTALDAVAHLSSGQKVFLREMLKEAAAADAYFAGASNLAQVLPAAPVLEGEGDMCGPYKLIRKLGEGGFGVVWMAEQTIPISRMVALKVIKAGMDTQQVLARFEAERQALAMMDHPNIAKVLDAGATPTGRPWFAMELVKGIPITDYCDQAGLGTNDRLALFREVCAAISHAHQKGIIHRDIKPSNVMVTRHGDKPVVKVIDFGIAKATQGKLTDRTLFTLFEQFIGTPVYMSPEQAGLSGLDIDTRSDIYSLGILLYELLVGKPPFDPKTLISAGYEEMRRIIREVEPVKPSSRLSTIAGEERALLAKTRRVEEEKLTKLVEPDLDWIVMKAIEKDRTRRYMTADAFAEDIARFLSDETVTATPPSSGYRFRKFARRNKATLRVAAGIALLLVAGTVVSSWQAVRATKAERKVRMALEEVAAERDAKEKARKDAVAISTYLGEVFESPDPTRDGHTITVAESLDKAAKKLETDLADQPETRAMLQFTLAKTYHALSLTPKAVPLQEMARDYFLATYGPEYKDTLVMTGSLALYYASIGRMDEAINLQEGVLELNREAHGSAHPNTLGAMANLASFYSDHGRREEAVDLREKILALSRMKLGPEQPETLGAIHNLAVSYSLAGRRDEALELREEVLALSRTVLGPKHPDTLAAMYNLSNSYADIGRRDEAIQILEEVLKLSLTVYSPEHRYTLDAMSTLALCYFHVGRRDEALDLREKILARRLEMLGPEHPDTLAAMHSLAISYSHAGRRDKALEMQQKVLAGFLNVNGRLHPNTLDAMNNLAFSLSLAGRWDEAIKIHEELAPLLRKVKGPKDKALIKNTLLLASNYQKAGHRNKALELREEALALARTIHGPEHPDTLDEMHNLAIFYEETGRAEQALEMRKQLLELRRKVHGPEPTRSPQ